MSLTFFREVRLEEAGLDVRWARFGCFYPPEVCEIREHAVAFAACLGVDRWCAVAHATLEREDRDLFEAFALEAWDSMQRAAVAFGSPWGELDAAVMLLQLQHALGLGDGLWDELNLWELDKIDLMVRRGAADVYAVPALLRACAWYRADTGGSSGPVATRGGTDGD